MTGQHVWLVDGPDGCYGVYASEKLARAHIARMSDPAEFSAEREPIRASLMPGIRNLPPTQPLASSPPHEPSPARKETGVTA